MAEDLDQKRTISKKLKMIPKDLNLQQTAVSNKDQI